MYNEVGDEMKLKVIADDLGITKGVNYGIYDACKDGIVTSVALLVNTKYTDHAYELIKDLDVSIGLELNVTYGKALSSDALTAYGFLKPTHDYKEVIGDIEKEFEAQIEKAFEMNIEIAQLSSYENIHYTYDVVNELLFKFGEKYNIPVRDERVCSHQFSGQLANMETLFYLLKQNTDYFEMAVRPGYLDGHLINIHDYREMRMVEHSIITSDYVKKLVQDENIELVK